MADRSQAAYTFSIWPISLAQRNQVNPKVYGNVVVWEDSRNEQPDGPENTDIYGYDLITHEEFPISTAPGKQVWPNIWGDFVVWTDYRDGLGNPQVYAYDLSRRVEMRIAPGVAAVINSEVVAYLGSCGGTRNICLYSIRDKSIRALEDVDPGGLSLSKDGSVLVWTSHRDVSPPLLYSHSHIYVYDLSIGRQLRISEAPVYLPRPAVTKNFVIWRDFPSGLTVHDLSTGNKKTLPTRVNDYPLAVSGHMVAFGGSGSEPGPYIAGIYLYDLERGRQFFVTGSSQGDSGLGIYGDMLVWAEPSVRETRFPFADRDYNIYAATISFHPDYLLSDGHFYTQARGEGAAGTGYAIVDDAVAPLWSEFQRLGGVEALGYPVSRRFTWDGFVSQAMQKQVFQWQPEAAEVAFINVFDELTRAGKDEWLLVYRQVPKPLDNAADAPLSWEEVKQRHWQLLEADPAIQERYWADGDPLAHYGLPQSYGDFGNVFVVRAQRAVLQHWKEDVPWAAAGEVTIANGGDIAKEAGLLPKEATVPEEPPGE